MTELKPCPFCGGEARFVADYDVEQVYCVRCGATVEYLRDYYDEGDLDGTHVIPMWNRRVSLTDYNC